MTKASRPVSPACAICGKPVDARFKPFCSARCADVDLNRWLSGRYVIPGAQAPEDEEDRPAAARKDEEN
jgi:endogenous inhibitor of DNA gyrase (YacG/DUF329 family)